MRKCLECGAEMEGRSDKKFCSDLCRNTYNNKLYRKARNVISYVNRRLASNRRILDSLYSDGRTTVSKSLLEEERFDFGYYTSSSKNRLGRTTYRCYEFTYSSDKHNNITIEKD